MQQIERYGVIALVFLLVTIVAVSFWGDSKSPGFWSRLTGRGAKKDAASTQIAAAPESLGAPGATGERALDTELPLSPLQGASSPITPIDPVASAGTSPEAASPSFSAAWSQPARVPEAAPQVATPLPAPVRMPAATEPAPGHVEYVVRKGDSLIQIAARTLGQKSRWTEIRDLNQGIDPRSLRVGMKLALPAYARTTKASAQPKSPVPVRKASPAIPSRNGGGAKGIYVVRKGDTLKSIAQRLLGQSSRWREIASANPKLDPRRMLVGASIRVPAAKPEPLVAAAAVRTDTTDRPRVR